MRFLLTLLLPLSAFGQSVLSSAQFTSFAQYPVPPVISGVSAGTPGTNYAIIAWTTDMATTNDAVLFSTDTSYAWISNSVAGTTSHSIALSNLAPATTYNYKVASKAYGVSATNTSSTFATASMASACTTVADSFTGAFTGDYANEGRYAAYYAFKFTAASTYTACSISLGARKSGAPAQTFWAGIYTDSSGNPGTLVGTHSTSIGAAAFGTSLGAVNFPGVSASISSGTAYWIVVRASATDVSNYIIVANLGYTLPGTRYSDNGTSWTDDASDYAVYFQIYQ